MEQNNDVFAMLDLLTRGAFCVKNGTIVAVNETAKKYAITTDTAIEDLLITGKQEYKNFQTGCLYLTLQLSGNVCGASVSNVNGYHVFVLEQDEDLAELQTMALAAQELRKPLTGIMTVADNLFPLTEDDADPELREQVTRINRGLFQVLRIVSNMSDAYRYCQTAASHQQTGNICNILQSIFDKAAPLISHTGLTLEYTGINESIYCLVDEEKLERAINNILSNAIKFSPKGSVIRAHLTRNGSMLYLTVQDENQDRSNNIPADIYSRFRREPGIEDSRFGLGLGMVLIRSAAAAHGGTVLMEQPPEHGTRLTMTLSIRQSNNAAVRSSNLLVDYAGEWDHGLLEFSENLPAGLYGNQN